jgi:phosphoribosylglycinamide formyltransferase-1
MQADPAPKPKAVILISGNGSNLQAFIDEIATESLNMEISAVISNRPDAYGLTRALEAGIKTHGLDHKRFESRELFDLEIIKIVEGYQPDLIILAGYMRILTNDFVKRYQGKLINIHPSLLPKYPGLNTHRRAIENNDSVHGVTVHFVVPELDAGPNIVQAEVNVRPNDTAETLAQRVQEQEHVIYPIAVKWFIEGRLQLVGDHVELDSTPLPESGLILDSKKVLH